MADENDSELAVRDEAQAPDGDEDVLVAEDWWGVNELLRAIGSAIKAKRSKEALAGLVEAFSADVPRKARRADHWLWLSHGLAAFAISVVALLGYLETLDKSTVGTLMGAIVGSLFYRGKQG